MNTIVTQFQGKGFYLAQIKNSDLAIFSYYIESQKECFIIDPTFDTKIYNELIKNRGSTLKHVLVTHYHADFISGHLQFKVPLIMGPGSRNKMNKYQINQLKDGQQIYLGSVKFKAIHTPGHTIEGVSYLLKDSEGNNFCVFTGDTLFLGDVGRPDLSVGEGYNKVDLATMLFQSIQRLKSLEDNLRIYPAHGSGSACAGKKIDEGNFSTIGEQKQKNNAMKIQGKNQFISTIVQDIDKPPSYYFHDSKINKIGPNPHQLQLKKASNALNVQQFANHAKISKIFDTRPSTEGGVIKGSYWTHNKAPITSWIPMVAEPHDEILVVVQEGKGEETVQRFVRLGFFNVKGFNNFKVSDYPGQKQVLKVHNGKQVLEIIQRTHLDVRNKQEWKKTGIIEGAITIPLKQLKNRAHEVKGLKNIVINCKTGMRARFAMSILANSGIKAIVVGEKVQQLQKIGFKMLPYIEKEPEE